MSLLSLVMCSGFRLHPMGLRLDDGPFVNALRNGPNRFTSGRGEAGLLTCKNRSQSLMVPQHTAPGAHTPPPTLDNRSDRHAHRTKHPH